MGPCSNNELYVIFVSLLHSYMNRAATYCHSQYKLAAD